MSKPTVRGGRGEKSISVSNELDLVRGALNGVRLLLLQCVEHHFTDEDFPRVADALHATVVLLRERLRLMDRVVRDTLDPAVLIAPENEADPELVAEWSDVNLAVWSEKKIARRLRREVERAERRLEVLRQRGTSKDEPRP